MKCARRDRRSKGDATGNASSPTFREFLNLLISVTPEPALKTDEFKAAWDAAAKELDEIIDKLKGNEGDAGLIYERDAKVRRLIALIRTDLRDSYLFNDTELQKQAGSTALSDYERFLETDSATQSKYAGHNCDGIAWGAQSEILPPPVTSRSMEFPSGAIDGHPYASCWDHAITNLICKTWGYSKMSYLKTPCADKLVSGRTYKPKDKSIFLALMLGVHKSPGANWLNVGASDVMQEYVTLYRAQQAEREAASPPSS